MYPNHRQIGQTQNEDNEIVSFRGRGSIGGEGVKEETYDQEDQDSYPSYRENGLSGNIIKN